MTTEQEPTPDEILDDDVEPEPFEGDGQPQPEDGKQD
jgi:hypothetical protein